MNDKAITGEREAPRIGWVILELEQLRIFVDVCIAGLLHATHAVEALQAGGRCPGRRTPAGGEEHRTVDPILEKANRFSEDQVFERVLNEAKKIQDFAQGEMPEGFPYLFSLATIRMWSLMESAIDDLIVDVMRLCPQTRQLPVIQRLKGPLVPFSSSSLDEQAEYLVNLLKEEVRASFQPGIGRFETILNAVGLGGPVHDEVRRAFLELSEIRHVLVHRRGKADAKLLDRCPWLPFTVGTTVKVREAELRLFHLASLWYVIEIEHRLALFQHETQPTEEGKIQAKLEKSIVEVRAHLAGTTQSELQK